MDEAYQSYPIIRTKGGAKFFMKLYSKRQKDNKLKPCYLGHENCSHTLYGPCLVEVLQRLQAPDDPGDF